MSQSGLTVGRHRTWAPFSDLCFASFLPSLWPHVEVYQTRLIGAFDIVLVRLESPCQFSKLSFLLQDLPGLAILARKLRKTQTVHLLSSILVHIVAFLLV